MDDAVSGHERLTAALGLWAKGKGYTNEANKFFSIGLRPQFVFSAQGALLFIGEAKSSSGLPIADSDTFLQFWGHVTAFAELLRDGEIKGGMIAIATDDAVAAVEWEEYLNSVARAEGLLSASGTGKSCQMVRTGEHTWIISLTVTRNAAQKQP